MFAAVKGSVSTTQPAMPTMIRRRMTQISRTWTDAQRRRRAIEAAIMQRRLFGAQLSN